MYLCTHGLVGDPEWGFGLKTPFGSVSFVLRSHVCTWLCLVPFWHSANSTPEEGSLYKGLPDLSFQPPKLLISFSRLHNYAVWDTELLPKLSKFLSKGYLKTNDDNIRATRHATLTVGRALLCPLPMHCSSFSKHFYAVGTVTDATHKKIQSTD